MTGSTVLGQALDAETLRSIMGRYFAELPRSWNATRGGVAKFIGDAVMAVFGLPRRARGDALRAVEPPSTCAGARAHNAELGASWGVTVAVRTGVNTGEVMVAATRRRGPVVGDRSTSPPGSSRSPSRARS